MNRLSWTLAMGFAVLTVSAALAADTVKLRPGTPGPPPKPGKITEMSATGVMFEDLKKIPVNEIESVKYDGEPNDLTQARNQINKGAYDEALKLLGKIDVDALKRPEIKQDVEFYKAICAAREALYGSRDRKELEAAGKQLVAFSGKNTNNYHYFEACEAVGDILATMGLVDRADSYYSKLDAAPWPDYRMRAAVLAGRAYESQKDYAKAIKKFDEVIAQKDSGNEVEKQRQAAILGKGTALAATGNVDEAIKLISDVIDKADPENRELHARAYNARGNCYVLAARRPPAESGGRSPIENKKHALTDFLHVDLLYASFPEQHAEALANLSTLWKDVNKPRRADEAQAELLKSYPNSIWAKRTPAQP